MNKYNKCHSKQKIANEISNIFNKFKKSGPFTIKHPADKTCKSNVKQIQLTYLKWEMARY